MRVKYTFINDTSRQENQTYILIGQIMVTEEGVSRLDDISTIRDILIFLYQYIVSVIYSRYMNNKIYFPSYNSNSEEI